MNTTTTFIILALGISLVNFVQLQCSRGLQWHRKQIEATNDLIKAVKKGNIIAAQEALNKGALVTEPYTPLYVSERNEGSPLHIAQERNDRAMIKLLVDHHNAQVEVTMALIKAIESGNVNAAQEALNKGALVAGLNKAQIPLHLAVKRQDPNMVKLLLDHGALINQTDNDKQTPLTIALLQNRFSAEPLPITTYLIARGAEISPHQQYVYREQLNKIPVQRELGLFYLHPQLFEKSIAQRVEARGVQDLNVLIKTAGYYDLKDVGRKLIKLKENLRTLLQKKGQLVGKKLKEQGPQELVHKIVSYVGNEEYPIQLQEPFKKEEL
jgi:hypothetical protein